MKPLLKENLIETHALMLVYYWGTPISQAWKGLTPHSRLHPHLTHSLYGQVIRDAHHSDNIGKILKCAVIDLHHDVLLSMCEQGEL